MADILLQKPQGSQTVTFSPQSSDRLVFDFNPNEALLERDGENLVLSFEDGSSIELADFYVSYSSDNMPEFVIDNSIVPGESFFSALSEDLMPAAGNEGSSPQGSGTGVGTEAGNLNANNVGSLGGDQSEYTPGGSNVPNTRQSDNNTQNPDGTQQGDGGQGGAGFAGPVDNGVVLEHQAESVSVVAVETTYFTGEVDFSVEALETQYDNKYNHDAIDNTNNTGGVTVAGGKIVYKEADGTVVDNPYFEIDSNVTSKGGGTDGLDLQLRHTNWNGGGGLGVAGGHSSWSEIGYEAVDTKIVDGKKVADEDYKGEYSEAIVFDLPEGETAYGVNIELDNLYPGGTKFDNYAEKALVQFYLDGELQTSIEVVGTNADGYALVENPNVPFDRIIISSLDNGDRLGHGFDGLYQDNNSDFFVKKVTFLEPNYIAEVAGNVDATAADGFDQFYFEGLSIDGVKVSIGLDGTIDTSETLSIDGKDVTLSLDPATNTLVGQADGVDQFTFTLDPQSGEWSMQQHEEFSESITLGIGGVDSDGSTASLDIDIEPRSDSNITSGTNRHESLTGTDSDDTIMGLAGDDTIDGGFGDDALFGGSGDDSILGGTGDDALFGGTGSDELYGGEGSDLIEFDIADALVDGGTDADGSDMDVLLSGLGDKQDVINSMEAGDITNMEMLVFGNDVNGKNVDDVLTELGLSTNADDKLVVPADDWTQGGSKNIGGKDFMEFTNDSDTTILVETTKLESGNF